MPGAIKLPDTPTGFKPQPKKEDKPVQRADAPL